MSSSDTHLNMCGVLFQVFGQIFFSVKNLKIDNQKKFPTLASTLHFIIAFIFLTTQIVAYTIAIESSVISQSLTMKTALSLTVQYLMLCGIPSIIWVNLIQSYMATLTTKKFFLNILKISKMCQRDFSYGTDSRILMNEVLRSFASIILFVMTKEISVLILEEYSDRRGPFYRRISAFFSYVYIFTIGTKFCFMVNIINVHLELISKLIQEVFNVRDYNVGILGLYPKNATSYQIKELQTKILKIKQIYNLVFENAEIINQSMGITILTIATVSIISITVTGFRIFEVIVGNLPISVLPGKSFSF